MRFLGKVLCSSSIHLLGNPLAFTNWSCYTKGMVKKRSRNAQPPAADQPNGYDDVLAGISELLESGDTIPTS
jgi:hypothetical protein